MEKTKISSPMELYERIEKCLQNPPEQPQWSPLSMKRTKTNDEYRQEYYIQVYKNAITHVLRLRAQNPSMPRLPSEKSDPVFGLQSIQDWCIESQKRGNNEPAEPEHENKDTKKKREGEIEPKPPEILQKILWILKHGREHWKLVLLAILVLLICYILTLLK